MNDPHNDKKHSSDHGPCCICEGTHDVNVLVLVTKRAPVPGTGWGCVVCHLPQDGAIAVICGKCAEACPDQAEAERRLKFVCHGYVMKLSRAPASEASEPFNHDPAYHTELAGLMDYTVGVES
jgi:hypothetical protein